MKKSYGISEIIPLSHKSCIAMHRVVALEHVEKWGSSGGQMGVPIEK